MNFRLLEPEFIVEPTCAESKCISFLPVCLRNCFETKTLGVGAQEVKKTNTDHNKTSKWMSSLPELKKQNLVYDGDRDKYAYIS